MNVFFDLKGEDKPQVINCETLEEATKEILKNHKNKVEEIYWFPDGKEPLTVWP